MCQRRHERNPERVVNGKTLEFGDVIRLQFGFFSVGMECDEAFADVSRRPSSIFVVQETAHMDIGSTTAFPHFTEATARTIELSFPPPRGELTD